MNDRIEEALRLRGSSRWRTVAGGLAGLGNGRQGVAEVAVGAAGGGGEQLACEGLAAAVADHGAQLLHAVREPAPPVVGARAALPLVAQLRLWGALPYATISTSPSSFSLPPVSCDRHSQ